MNGYIHDPRGSRPSSVDSSHGSRDQPLPHIDDIRADVAERIERLRFVPVTRMLEEARKAFNSARFLIENRKGLAAAYADYLFAYELVVSCVPRNPEFMDRISTSRSGLHRQYKELTRVCSYIEP
jgi:hypothetical protein